MSRIYPEGEERRSPSVGKYLRSVTRSRESRKLHNMRRHSGERYAHSQSWFIFQPHPVSPKHGFDRRVIPKRYHIFRACVEDRSRVVGIVGEIHFAPDARSHRGHKSRECTFPLRIRRHREFSGGIWEVCDGGEVGGFELIYSWWAKLP